ncbi:MAG TPA: HEAT repeat domain-containing protein, partial [Acidobacteriota bacterium]|nr:HEAT repeat domain-containing protein [Acidobacteriota bacterium]
LKDESPDVRIDAILALKTSNDLTALNELADALKDPILEVKSAAAEVLGYHGKNATTAVLAALDESLGKRQFQTARFGVRAAGIIGSTEFVPVLLDALTCEDGFVASEAALALGKIRDLRACPDLIDALQHKDANVRFAAVQALGNLADPQAVSALETRLRDDSDEGIQAKALWAINRIRRKPFGTSTMTAIHTSTNLK